MKTAIHNPWAWVPTLYIAEGLPNVIVTSVAVVLYMQLGLSDAQIGLYTGWLGLPCYIDPVNGIDKGEEEEDPEEAVEEL